MAQIPNGPNVVYVTQPPTQTTCNAALSYTKIYKQVGITQLVFGGLSIILGAVNLIIGASTYFSGLAFCVAGIWAGGMMIAAGVLAFKAGRNPTKCLMTAGLTVSIFAAVFAAGMITLETIGAYNSGYYHYYNGDYWDYYRSERLAQLSFHVILASIALGELITAIVHSAYCCAGYCCASSSSSSQAMPVNNTMQGQVMYIPAGQPQQQYGHLPQPYVIQGHPNQSFVYFQPPTSQTGFNAGAPNSQQGQEEVRVMTQPPRYAVNGKTQE